MKRQGKLIDQITDIDNLRLAYYKAKKGKIPKQDYLLFTEDLDNNLLALSESLIQNIWQPESYKLFTIKDPKERIVAAAPFKDRVVHHALMNICHDNFEKYLIDDTYATRQDKGVYKALKRAIKFHQENSWYLKLDVRKYFETIDHNILKVLLNKRFKDQNVLNLFYKIIDGYQVQTLKGIPIGSLVSQYFANHYLGYADHYIKESLQVKAYVRYMDDMVLWSRSKKHLCKIRDQFQEFINKELHLTLKPFTFNHVKKVLPFLSYLITPDKLLLSQKSRKRFIKKYTAYEKNLHTLLWEQKTYQAHICPLLAFIIHADSFGFRKKVILCSKAILKREK